MIPRYSYKSFRTRKALFLGILAALLLTAPSYSQSEDTGKKEPKYNFSTQLKFDYGGIVESVRKEGIESYYGFDLRFALQKRKNDVYSTVYRTPYFGGGIYSGNFLNESFGKPFGIYGFYDIPVVMPNKWSFIYSIGLGMAFNFNYYDPEGNPENELIGSFSNVYISVSMEGRYQLTPHWTTGIGMGFKHFSNGRVRLPNRGINLVPVTLMAEYHFEKQDTDYKKNNLAKFIPYNSINVFGAVGNKNFEYGEAVYFKSSLGVSFIRQHSYKYRFGGGAELFYTAGSDKRVDEDKSNFNTFYSYGFVGIFEWVVTPRMYVPMNFGVYLNYNEENYEAPVYQRIGLRYLLGKDRKIITGVCLKVTEFHADYVEWTVGYAFKNDKNKYKLLF